MLCIIEHTIYNILNTLFRVAFSFLLASYIPHLWGKQFRGSLYDSVADAGKTSMAAHRGSKKSGN